MGERKEKSIDKWLILFVVVIGTFMSILDSSIVNIAVPKMMTIFGVSMDEVKWILTSYTLALGAIIPLTGFLADIFGNKRLYIFALGMFSIGSLLCGFAWSNTTMIIFRIIQALGGGMIMPVGMSIIYQTFPEKERGLALGFWGIASMAAPTIGPTLGGYIIENLDWRLIFNINVPIGVVGVFMAMIFLKNTPRKPFKDFDYMGFIFSTVGLVSILYVLGEGSSIDWTDPKNPILMTLGVMCIIIFIFNELTHKDPLLDLRVFKIFEFTLSQIISCVLTFALMGGTYVLPLFLQNLRGYTPMETGLILFPSAIAVGVMMPISGSLFDKFGAKPIVFPGMIILGITSWLLAGLISLDSAKNAIVLMLTIRGIGLGLSMMPINTAGMNAVPMNMIPKASALSNTIRQISAALSITVMTTLIQNRLDYNYSFLSEQITSFNQSSVNTISNISQYLILEKGVSTSSANSTVISKLSSIVQQSAYTEAMKYSIEISVFAIIICILAVFLMRTKKKNSTQS